MTIACLPIFLDCIIACILIRLFTYHFHSIALQRDAKI